MTYEQIQTQLKRTDLEKDERDFYLGLMFDMVHEAHAIEAEFLYAMNGDAR